MLPVELVQLVGALADKLTARVLLAAFNVSVAAFVHDLLSVTVRVYVFAATLVRFAVVAPLLHKYVYGAVPPVTVEVMLPVELVQLVGALADKLKAIVLTAAFNVSVAAFIHDLLSVTVTV